jgi:hypothetical protein
MCRLNRQGYCVCPPLFALENAPGVEAGAELRPATGRRTIPGTTWLAEQDELLAGRGDDAK